MVIHRLLPGLAICLLLIELGSKLFNLSSEDGILPADLVDCLLKLTNVVNRYTSQLLETAPT
jgi:hypothetical protein